MKQVLKRIFWKLPIGEEIKRKIAEKRYERILKKELQYDNSEQLKITSDLKECKTYTEYILGSYGKKSSEHTEYKEHNKSFGTKIFAYYLTQFHPNRQNDEWWGKGTTEWNNVNQALPQFVGHYQPRKPGELGYYDLRIKDNISRQIELAKNYGVSGFCFYYYWFDGDRLLEKPLNIFLEDKSLKIDFFYCWANENWTKRFSGVNDEILMGITETEENYKRFIWAILNDMKDSRYMRVDGAPALSIYRPGKIPNIREVLRYWREIVKQELNLDLYLIAVQEKDLQKDWTECGFDAMTEFQPKQVLDYTRQLNDIKLLRKDFAGTIYDYKDLVENERYKNNYSDMKIYPAVMPMWDNTARRNFRGTIFHGSTPTLYKEWLKEAIRYVKNNQRISDIVFINAWNEWGEGTYLEPDYYYGYAYLEETFRALCEASEE